MTNDADGVFVQVLFLAETLNKTIQAECIEMLFKYYDGEQDK